MSKQQIKVGLICPSCQKIIEYPIDEIPLAGYTNKEQFLRETQSFLVEKEQLIHIQGSYYHRKCAIGVTRSNLLELERNILRKLANIRGCFSDGTFDGYGESFGEIISLQHELSSLADTMADIFNTEKDPKEEKGTKKDEVSPLSSD